MVSATFSISASAPAATLATLATKPVGDHPSFFRQLLSELNPLQYVPVVGTIYRAVTGDTIPDSARIAGSLVVSGLIGGPVGLAASVGITLLEQLTGVDPEKLGDKLLANLGIGSSAHSTAPVAVAASSLTVPATTVSAPVATPAATTSEAASNTPAMAWSPAQYQAYDVARFASGTLSQGAMLTADMLNTAELARITRMS